MLVKHLDFYANEYQESLFDTLCVKWYSIKSKNKRNTTYRK